MRDLSRNHLLLFGLLFLALFIALFAGVVQVHKRSAQRHATALYQPADASTASGN